MIDTADPALNATPESFDGVRVNLANDVDFLAVVDSMMRVSPSVKAIVGTEIIGEHGRAWENVFLDESMQGVGFHVGSDECANAAFALDHANDRSFLGSAPACSFGTTPAIRDVHFDLDR